MSCMSERSAAYSERRSSSSEAVDGDAGASGFVGRRLCVALEQAGDDVAAMTRNPARYRGADTPVRGDVQDPA
jgi:NAD dependent epimerase/dehydratase family